MMSFLPFNLFGALPDIIMGRDPKDALLGNAAAVTSTLAVPGLLNGGATPGFNPTQSGMLAAQEQGLGNASLGWGGATTGMQGALNSTLGSSLGSQAGGLLGSADKIIKPVSTGMQAAQMFQDEPQQLPPPPQLLPPTTSPTLGQIVQGNTEQTMLQNQLDQQKRDMRRKRIGLMGGY